MPIPHKPPTCEGCPAYSTGQGFVPPVGPADARVALLGQGPGEQEAFRSTPFCLEANTLVLKADLQWVPIAELAVGDKLLTVHENTYTGHRNAARRWTIAEITATHTRRAKCIKVITDKAELIGTPDHRVLAKSKARKPERAWKRLDEMTCQRLNSSGSRHGVPHGTKISFIGEPWCQLVSYEAGWLAGFLDGEGFCLGSKGGTGHHSKGYVGWAQNVGPIADLARKIATELGFELRSTEEQRSYTGNIIERVHVAGGLTTTARFLGMIRPKRIIKDFIDVVAKQGVGSRLIGRAAVLAKFWCGEHDVVDISTTAGTFIANGFIVHNCGPSGDRLNYWLQQAGLDRHRVWLGNAVQCLDGATTVYLPGWKRMRVSQLVSVDYRGPILSCDPKTNAVVVGTVYGTHRSALENRRWLVVTHEGSKRMWNGFGSRVTNDHRFLTVSGDWVRADELAGELMVTGRVSLGPRAQSVAIGTLLGDATISSHSGSLAIGHSLKQKEWAALKCLVLGSRYSETATNARGYTKANGFVASLREQFYTPKKEVPENIRLDPQSLATWFLDDGSVAIRHKSRRHYGELATCCFNRTSVERLQAALSRDLGINTSVIQNGKYLRLYIGPEAFQRVAHHISKYVTPAMSYKLGDLRTDDFDPNLWKFEGEFLHTAKAVVSESRLKRKRNLAYCLSVTPWENFLTTAGVAHNCWLPAGLDERGRPYGNREPTAAEVRACRERHWDSALPLATVTVAVGQPAAKALGCHSLGVPTQLPDGRWQLAIMHPSAIQRGAWAEEPAQIIHLERARAIAESGTWPQPEPALLSYPTVGQIEWWLAEARVAGLPVAIDIEAAGPHLVCLGLCRASDESCLCVRFRRPGGDLYWSGEDLARVVDALDRFLADPRVLKVTHNGQSYDVPQLMRCGFSVVNWADTMLMQHGAYPEMRKSLETVASLYCGMAGWKAELGEDTEGEGK